MKQKTLALMTLLALLMPLAAAQAETGGNGDNSTAIAAFDDSTTIESANWDNNGVTLVFESDFPRMATITDVNSIPASGVGEVNHKKVRLSSGRTKVRMETEMRRGDMTVTVGVGKTLLAVSNPAKPLFDQMTRVLAYSLLLAGVLGVPFQIRTRQFLDAYMLKRGLVRN